MLRAIRILFLFFPVLVFSQVPKTDSQLSSELQNLIPNNTQKLISPANVRTVVQDGWDARISIYGQSKILGKLTYNTLFPITNDGDLIYKAYLDERIAGLDSTGGGGGVTSFEGRIGPVFLDSLDLVGLAYPRYSNPSGFLTNINPTTVRNMFSQGTGITYSSITGQISFSGTTSNVPEGSNLYFTAGRVKALFASSPTITFNSTTGTYSIIGLTTLGTAGQQVRINTAGTGFEYFTPGASLTTSQAIVLNGPDVTGTGTIGGGIPTTITNNAVTTAKINNGAVTIPKMSASGTPDATKFHRGNDTWSQINYTDIVGTPTGGSQVQSDYTQSNSAAVDFIKNKPTLSTVAGTGQYSDLIGKPTIPAAQIQSDWNQTNTVALDFIKNKPAIATQVPSDWNATTGVTRVLNKPTLSTVATSGSYNDLLAKPTIPAAQINSDWNATTGLANILNKPNLSLYELTSNKVTNLNSPNNTTFPTTKAVQDALDTLAAHSGGAVSGVELTASEPLYTSGSGSGLCYLLGSDGLPILGSDGIPLSGPCGGFAINIRYADSSTAGIITAAKYRYLSNLDLNYVNKASTNVNPTWITSIAKSKITGLIDPVNADWNSVGGLSQILNKPTIPAAQVNSDWNATTGVAQILNKPTIPAQFNPIQGANITITGTYPNITFSTSGTTQVNSDWSSSSGVSRILNKPTFSTVATTGSYSDLTGKPTIPAAQINSDWNATSGLAVILNKPTFTTPVNADWNAVAGLAQILNKPTNLSVFANGPGYITGSSSSLLTNKSGNISQWTNNVGYITSSSLGIYIPRTGTAAGNPVTGSIEMIADANFKSSDIDLVGDGSVLRNNEMKLYDPSTSGISFKSTVAMDFEVRDDYNDPGHDYYTSMNVGPYTFSFNAEDNTGGVTTTNYMSLAPFSTILNKVQINGQATIQVGTNPYLFTANYFNMKKAHIYPPVLGDSLKFEYRLPSKSGTIALKSDIPTGGGGITTEADPVFTSTGALKATTISINGVTQSIASSRSWTIPTYSSAGASGDIQTSDGVGSFGAATQFNFNSSTNKFFVGATEYHGFANIAAANALSSPAVVNIVGGTTSKAGLRLVSGSLLTSPVNGSVEYDGTHAYFTVGSTRKQIDNDAPPSTLTINNNVNNRVLTANGTTGSIDAESGMTIDAFGNVIIPNLGGGSVDKMVITSSSGALSSTTMPVSLTAVAFGSTPNSNGGSIATNTLTLQPANLTNPGGLSNGFQYLGSGSKSIGKTSPSTTVTSVSNQQSSSSFGLNAALYISGSETPVSASFTHVANLSDNTTDLDITVGQFNKKFLLSSSGNLTIPSHLIGKPGGVTATLGTAGGSTSSGSYNLDINCSDLSGKISLTTGSSLSGTDVITVTFLTPYTIPPYVTFSPGNSIAANFVGLYVTSTTTGFTIKNGAGSLALSAAYVWTYTVSQ